MLSKLVRRVSRIKGHSTSTNRIRVVMITKRYQTNMYCMQCEQTSHGLGCTSQGICGKWPETANMQDLLLYVNSGIGQYVTKMGEDKLDQDLKEKTRAHVIESTFSTLTNVNFSEERMVDYLKTSIDVRETLKSKFRQIHPELQDFEKGEDSPSNYVIKGDDENSLNEDALRLASLYASKKRIGDANCFGLRECALYGLKGMMAYFGHAELMSGTTGHQIYSQEARDEIYKVCFGVLDGLMSTSQDLNYWLGVNMEVGATNVKVLSLLDQAHTTLFGIPEPTSVSSVPVEGPAILLSGHDVLDVKRVLDVAQKKNLNVNVYTHGELLPAHSYPELKKFKNFVGHFGTAWQNQYKDFKDFPGPILMTTNCLMPPRSRYRDRLYTTRCVGYDDVKHIDAANEKDVEMMLKQALELPGFDQSNMAKWAEVKPHLTGFGHAAILSHADTVVSAIKSGALQHIFVIGGCDGTEKTRSYFRDLAEVTPDNSLILTLGCGKFRLHGLELGDIGGIPRILDVGQCNDAYSAVVVAMKLAEALDTDIHHLPLHFAVSWFEQKAVAIFLSLLHLGIKNIRLGPALPAFLTDDVRQYLFQNLGVRQVSMGNEKEDLKQMLAETPQ